MDEETISRYVIDAALKVHTVLGAGCWKMLTKLALNTSF